MKRAFSRIIRAAAAVIFGMAAAELLTMAVCSESYEDQSDSKPSTSAYAYSLYCANNGTFLLGQNADERLPMASTTKIMTALLGLEFAASGDDTNVTITPEMYAEGSSMYLASGEVLPMDSLVGGMLMVSGNDAANAVALTVGGSFEGFADMMNKRAAVLGLENTHFVTPSGLDAQGHYTTANDLCRLMAACMENEQFASIDRESCVTVDFIEPSDKSTTYYNENKLLSRYEYCVAGKTGFTDSAGRTLVSAAEKDGIRLIAVTLNDADDWNDHAALFDYGFERLSMEKPEESGTNALVQVVGGEAENVRTVCGEAPQVVSGGAQVTVEYCLPRFVYAPVSKGEIIGELRYYTGGVYAGKADIKAAEEIGVSAEKTTFVQNLVSFFRAVLSRRQRS